MMRGSGRTVVAKQGRIPLYWQVIATAEGISQNANWIYSTSVTFQEEKC